MRLKLLLFCAPSGRNRPPGGRRARATAAIDLWLCLFLQLRRRQDRCCASATPPGARSGHDHHPLTALLLLAACIAARAPAAAADNPGEQRWQGWVVQASAQLDARAVAALREVTGADRRLLALRAYLRAGDSLAGRWSWTQEQLAAYPSSSEGKAAAADIDAVAAQFAAANPGFTLRVNRMPRSLGVQITHWNENRSVGIAAAALASALDRQFGTSSAPPDTAALRAALIAWTPGTAAALAAPGLSAHGQARAFDFQIEHGGKIIAGLDAGAARQQWDDAGWTQKLHAAVAAAGGHFSGPLTSPYEPWHYAYIAAPSAQ
jgi:hypothetical protein